MSARQEVEVYDDPVDGKDYILQVKIKNGPLLRAMRSRGFLNASQFCIKTGMNQTTVGRYLSLNLPPIGKTGKWKESALLLAKHLHLPPDCLFPEQHLQHALAMASGEIEISRDEVAALIEYNDPDNAERHELLGSAIQKMMNCLTPREERVLRLRYGFNGESKTLDEIGEEMGVGRERIRQIELRAFRKLKHPKNVKELADAKYVPAENEMERERIRRIEIAKMRKEEIIEAKARDAQLQEVKDELKAQSDNSCPYCNKSNINWRILEVSRYDAVIQCDNCMNRAVYDRPAKVA